MEKQLNINKQNNFKVPDGYFENLNNQLCTLIADKKNTNKVSSFTIFKPYIYTAACIVAIAITYKIITMSSSNNTINNTANINNVEQYADYISNKYYDDFLLFDYLYDTDDNTNFTDTSIKHESNNLVNDYYILYLNLEYELLNE